MYDLITIAALFGSSKPLVGVDLEAPGADWIQIGHLASQTPILDISLLINESNKDT